MDDEWGSNVWGGPEASASLPKPPIVVAAVVAAPESFGDFDDFGSGTPPPAPSDTGDDFDDFGDGFAAPAPAADDEFDDFGDFGDAVAEPALAPVPVTSQDWEPLRLRPWPEAEELQRQLDALLAPIFPADVFAQHTTDEEIRQAEGVNQVLVTAESRALFAALTAPPGALAPPNWTRSRTRRQQLISLGVPVNLDEVLPRVPARQMPQINISTRPMSAPPGARIGGSRAASTPHSRAGTPRSGTPARSAAREGLGAAPSLDKAKVNELLELNPDGLTLVSLPKLEAHLAEIKKQTVNASARLTHLLQQRDALQQESETHNRRIGELVSEATKRTSGKGRAPPTRKGTLG